MEEGGLRTLLVQLPFFSLQAQAGGGVGQILFDLAIVLLLILVNGIFAASEMAVVTLNASRIRHEAQNGDETAKRLLPFVDDPGNFMATIQIMITFAGFLSSASAGDRFTERIVNLVDPGRHLPGLNTWILIFITIVISYLSLVFGELVPKRIAFNNPDALARRFARTLIFFDRIMAPFTKLLNASTEWVLKVLKVPSSPGGETVTEEEIRMMVDAGSSSGNIHMEEGEMIENIFEFNDKEVSEIMTHRTNIVGLSIEADYDECLDVTVNERYSRFPVYEEDIDDIVGVLSIKDLLSYVANRSDDRFNLRDIIREPYLVPESKHVDQLLKEMQLERVSMAIAIDEYGGTAGLVTIEDLLEEIVGDIEDEYDDAQVGITRLSDGTYMVDGLLLLEDMERQIDDVEFDDETLDDFDTIAGLILDILGYIPDEGEEPQVTYKNLTLQVVAMDDNRIALVRMTVQPLEDYERRLEEERMQEQLAKEEQERLETEAQAKRDLEFQRVREAREAREDQDTDSSDSNDEEER